MIRVDKGKHIRNVGTSTVKPVRCAKCKRPTQVLAETVGQVRCHGCGTLLVVSR